MSLLNFCKNVTKIAALVSLCTVTSNANAVIFVTKDKVDGLWEKAYNRNKCVIIQKVNDWGNVEFITEAAKEKKLKMYLKPTLEFSKNLEITVREESPSWIAGVKDVDIAAIKVYKMFDGYADKEVAWYSLNSLQKGKALSFLYHDTMYYNNDEVKVLVSPIGFKKVYSEYQTCMNNLFDFSFDDIKYTSLDFVDKSLELSTYSLEIIDKITAFFEKEKHLIEFNIQIHTDSIGQESENKELTDRQRNVLKKLLMDKGFLPKNINIQSVGEEHLAVHDNSDINRRINSRVLMEIKYVDGTGR
jgi:outer membrane protein OmpA-like peptidoglycan-associated protein